MLALCLFLFVNILFAAPRLQQGSVVNAASFALEGTPNAAIARGSLFTVFGVDVGPAEAVRASSFPLPLELGGVSIRISSGGQDHPAVVLFAVSSQVSAILPSTLPAGEAILVLRYQGEDSNPVTISVADHQPGVFSRSQNGTGIAVVQNFISPANQPVNTLNEAAQPGQVAILWATGLGASRNGDDRNPPATGNLIPLEQVKVFVGGKEAAVEYAGRSGCCAGVDQINFVVPDGVEGCVVPVVVVLNGVASNFLAMSVSEGNTICDDPTGLSRESVLTLLSKDTISTGVVSLARVRSKIVIPNLGEFTGDSDVGSASFTEFTRGALLDTVGIGGSPVFRPGSCVIRTVRASGVPNPPDLTTAFQLRPLDAGQMIRVSGPKGMRTLKKVGSSPGLYVAPLTDIMVPADSFLVEGDYTIDNDAGGPDVQEFGFTAKVPGMLEWTNEPGINVVQRGQPLTITWNAGDAPSGVAAIFATASDVPRQLTSVMFCFADVGAGALTIPGHVTGAMVASDSGGPSAGPAGSVSVGGYSQLTRFSAPGLDMGFFFVSATQQKLVEFQ